MNDTSGNIRQILGHLIGQRLIDITQEDEEDRAAGRDGFVQFMFENGDTFKTFAADSDSYKSGFPFCFSDPKDKDDKPWEPSAEDLAGGGRWKVVEHYTEDGTVDHCLPMYGKRHFLEPECWCEPQKEFRDDGSWFFTHKEVPE
jgi:hypothetical protein